MTVRAKQLSRIGRIFADGRLIDAALRSAVRDAIRAHALDDVPVAIWRDGAVALVSARELSEEAPPRGARSPAPPYQGAGAAVRRSKRLHDSVTGLPS